MKKFYIFLSLFLVQFIFNQLINAQKWAIAIHGGAGILSSPNNFVDEKEKLEEALNVGISILKNGGTSLEAVESVINILEDSPLFNAGKGAVFTHEGKNELDASIMDGLTLNAGAVAGVTTIKNPISAAIKVMTNSKHVMLTGTGAEQFAKEQGVEIVDPSYFYTEKRWKSLQKNMEKDKKMGTVGCVALDINGNLVAGTSTGGMTNKRYGRIGDSPIIGAGTYANNKTCAISCTGHGEYFIRLNIAHDISAQMEYLNKPLNEAAQYTIQEKLTKLGGSGGVIAVDKDGNIVCEFNTKGMYRCMADSDGKFEVSVF